MIKYFEVTGTEYEMGYSVGNEFKEYLKESINKYEEKLKIKNVYNKVKNMVALKISGKEIHQKIMINIEVYRKIIQLIFSGIFTLILTKFDLSVVIIILCVLSAMEIYLNKKMYNRLIKLKV